MVVLKNKLDKHNNNDDDTMVLEHCPFPRIPEQLGPSYSSSPPAPLSTGNLTGTTTSTRDQASPFTVAGQPD